LLNRSINVFAFRQIFRLLSEMMKSADHHTNNCQFTEFLRTKATLVMYCQVMNNAEVMNNIRWRAWTEYFIVVIISSSHKRLLLMTS